MLASKKYNFNEIEHLKLGVVVHTCNPSYLGGRSRMVMSLRAACAKVGVRSYLKSRIKNPKGQDV
jgi:hypothetical protein